MFFFICQFPCASIFHRFVGEILLDHQRHFEDDGVVKFAQVKSCELLDFFQTVNKGVSVNKQLAGGFGNVQVVLEELLNGKQRFLIERLNGALLEDFLQEHLAEGIRQLINQSGYAEILVGNDGLFGVENLADLQRHLCLLEGSADVLDTGNLRADTDNAMGVKFTGQRIDDGTGKLLQIFKVNALMGFLDNGDLALVDADDKILVLVREEILDDIKSRDVRLGYGANQKTDAVDVRIEMQFAGFQITA